MNTKKELGQFYTINNPFKFKGFELWYRIFLDEGEKIVEPFAGSNNIIKLLREEGYNNKFTSFDISPSLNNLTPDVPVIKRNTIKDFPDGFKVAITNPPYLAKNSATRSNIEYVGDKYDDLYKECLDVMLSKCDYVAAIIPESFITSGLFHNRLFSVISLNNKMFDDTDCPVCLALFVPENKCNNDFLIYSQNSLLGSYKLLLKEKSKLDIDKNIDWKFNFKNGQIGIYCIDGTISDSIHFCRGEEIDDDKIKNTSRSITKVYIDKKIDDLDGFINKCNNILDDYRKSTYDVFMTSFKGLRKDGKYRRRLDFKTAKKILNLAFFS